MLRLVRLVSPLETWQKTGIEGGTAIGTFAEAMGKTQLPSDGRPLSSKAQIPASPSGLELRLVGRRARCNRSHCFWCWFQSRFRGRWFYRARKRLLCSRGGVVSFGSVGTKRRLVNIANGTANHNAATVGQLRGALSALGGEVDTNGNIVGPSFNVQGQSQSTLNGALEALDGAVVSTTSRVNQVESAPLRVPGNSLGACRRHPPAHPGRCQRHGHLQRGQRPDRGRQAMRSGGQLHSMQQQINGRMDGLEQRIDGQPQARATAAASTPSPSTEETAPAPETGGSPQIASTGEGDKPAPQPKPKQDDTPAAGRHRGPGKMLARANEYTDGAISAFERRLDKMDKRFNRMAAMSSAQSAMAMNTAGLATYNRLGAGVGYSEGGGDGRGLPARAQREGFGHLQPQWCVHQQR